MKCPAPLPVRKKFCIKKIQILIFFHNFFLKRRLTVKFRFIVPLLLLLPACYGNVYRNTLEEFLSL